MLAAALSSCQRSSESQAKAEEDRSAVQAAADALAAERARVQAEREALEAEKEELRMQREADLVAKEQELREREFGLELQGEEARLAAEALAAEQEALALREQELNAVELQQAGTTVIADWTPDEPEVVQEPVADYSLFYDELEPHGDWFETPDYGYVYQPTVVVQNRSWRPYTYGKWVCSNLGWTWRSDEPFGWATFHYGRWTLLSGRGWCWVPGSEWAPSWCAWREGGGHVGWAPLPPETLAYRGRGWGANVDVELGIASSWFNFVETRFMANPLVGHCFPVSRNASFIRSTRGCTNIQFLQNRIVSGGPSYADIYQRVNKPWPVCRLDLNAVGGIGRGRGAQDLRHGVRHGNQLQLFAPSLDAPWNARLRPHKVTDAWKNLQVVREESGLQQTWSRRLAESRERQRENAERWAQKNKDLKSARERQLQANREKVEAAQARIRENIARNVSLRQQQIKGTPAQPKGPAVNIPDRRGGGGVASTPDRNTSQGGAAAGDALERNGTRNGGATATTPDRNGSRTGEGMPQGRDGGRSALPTGVTRPGEPQRPSVVVPPARISEQRTPDKTSLAAEERLAEIRSKQQEAREKVAQRNEEIRAKFEEARSARSQPKSNDTSSNAAVAAMQERAAQAQQQRAQEAAQKAAQQAQAKADLQDRLRQQQEANRAKQEQAKMEIQRKIQEQQEKVRAAQEQAKQAQAERARQQAEQAQQREMASRQAAERAAREKQADAQRAAEQRAQQQAEMARRQEEARRAAQEKAQQQQEQAREAAEQRARQQQENQERIRQAQEQIREKIREQQEKRQSR